MVIYIKINNLLPPRIVSSLLRVATFVFGQDFTPCNVPPARPIIGRMKASWNVIYNVVWI